MIRFKSWKLSVSLTSILLFLSIIATSFAINYNHNYDFQIQFGLVSHELYVSIPASLYEYYQGKSSTLADDNQYAMLVTPNAVKPIADNIRNLKLDSSRRDEEFGNAVLTLVHQIPFTDCDIMYPIETLVNNYGRCDTLSLLAASIMKAGGLDVVLLYYKEAHHINVGVHLPYEPHTTWWWLPPTGYDLNGKKYWIAECTPAMNWKVGDIPPFLEGEQPTIITLENSEKISPAHVSSKLDSPLNPSSISINLSSEPADINAKERKLTVTGSLSPAIKNETITVYFSQDGISYDACKALTDSLGEYSFSWTLNSTGTSYVRTSWSGNTNHTGADSEMLTVFIGSPNSIIQFKGSGSFYGFCRGLIARYEFQVRQDVEDFLDVQMSGTGILVTGEFIILESEQKRTITRDGKTGETPKDAAIWKWMQPLRLPIAIEHTTNIPFGFILENSGSNNYSFTVKSLDTCEAARMKPSDEDGVTFMNSSAFVKENTWYKIIAKINEEEATAEVHNANGKVIERIVGVNSVKNVSRLVVLLANDSKRPIVFKNLSVGTFNQQIKSVNDNETAFTLDDLLTSHSNFILLTAAILVVGIYIEKKRNRED